VNSFSLYKPRQYHRLATQSNQPSRRSPRVNWHGHEIQETRHFKTVWKIGDSHYNTCVGHRPGNRNDRSKTVIQQRNAQASSVTIRTEGLFGTPLTFDRIEFTVLASDTPVTQTARTTRKVSNCG
jgi:hypothetical protein